jgi:sugar lactone lactonase YvrE
MTQIPVDMNCTKPQWSHQGVTVGTGLNGPIGLYVDQYDTVWVADYWNHTVQHFLPGSTKGKVVAGGMGTGNASNQLNHPSAVFVDKTGNLFVADKMNYRVQKFTPGSRDGTTVLGGRGKGIELDQFGDADGLFIDEHDQIFLSDFANQRILKFARGSKTGTLVIRQGELSDPMGIYIDRCNTLYVSDNHNHRVRKYPNMNQTAGETIMGVHGQKGSTSYRLNEPQALTVDKYGSVFVTDLYNHRIQRWSVRDNTTQTVAGITGVSGSDSQHLDRPYGVGLDSKVNLYVSDYRNHRIQKFDFISGDAWC